MPKKPGAWDVVSTAPAASQSARDGWNVVSVADAQHAMPTATPVPVVPPQTGLGAFLDASGARQIGNALLHPLDTASTVLDAARRVVAPNQPERLSDNPNPILAGVGHVLDSSKAAISQGVQDFHKTGLSQQTRRDFVRAIPIAGPALEQAQQYHDAGNDSAAVATLLGTATGLAAPKLLSAAPRAISGAAQGIGSALEDAGASRMDRFLNGGESLDAQQLKGKLPDTAQPGRRVLQEGPSVSVAPSRPAQVQAIQSRVPLRGQEVRNAVQQSTATVPWSDARQVVDDAISSKKAIAAGPGGNPLVGPRLDDLRTTFQPAIDSPGVATMEDLYGGRRNMDQNINWNRGPDPVDATVRNATRQIRGGMADLMYKADPSLIEANARFADLKTAEKLAIKNSGMQVKPLIAPGRMFAAVGAGAGTGILAHSPTVGAGVGLATEVLPAAWDRPVTQTGLATGAYQAGRGLQAMGRMALPDPALRVIRTAPLFGQLPANGISADSVNSRSDSPTDQGQNGNGPNYVLQQQNHVLAPNSPGISIQPGIALAARKRGQRGR